MNDSPRPILKSRIDSFRYALEGIWYALRTQPNTWIHAFITILVIGVGFWLRLNVLEWAFIAAATGLVWSMELMNTAFEAIVDLVSPDYHLFAKAAKDVSAGAVLIASMSAVVIGLLILAPRLWNKLIALVN